MCRHYDNGVVVFDGYANGPSTKHEIHQWRTISETVGLEIDLTPENPQNQQKCFGLSWRTLVFK